MSLKSWVSRYHKLISNTFNSDSKGVCHLGTNTQYIYLKISGPDKGQIFSVLSLIWPDKGPSGAIHFQLFTLD